MIFTLSELIQHQWENIFRYPETWMQLVRHLEAIVVIGFGIRYTFFFGYLFLQMFKAFCFKSESDDLY